MAKVGDDQKPLMNYYSLDDAAGVLDSVEIWNQPYSFKGLQIGQNIDEVKNNIYEAGFTNEEYVVDDDEPSGTLGMYYFDSVEESIELALHVNNLDEINNIYINRLSNPKRPETITVSFDWDVVKKYLNASYGKLEKKYGLSAQHGEVGPVYFIPVSDDRFRIMFWSGDSILEGESGLSDDAMVDYIAGTVDAVFEGTIDGISIEDFAKAINCFEYDYATGDAASPYGFANNYVRFRLISEEGNASVWISLDESDQIERSSRLRIYNDETLGYDEGNDYN